MIEDIRYPKVNWFLFALLILLMFGMLLYFDRAVAAEPDAKAAAMAHKTMDMMGGLNAWKQVVAIRFNFQVEHKDAPPRSVKHLWDRKNNRDHVEGPKDGKPMIAWVDLGTRKGMAWLDGEPLAGEDLNKAMEWAYGRWVNDTYWLIMPFKLLDSGVNLDYAGVKEGRDVLHLSFGKVGLTPGDQYWAYLNKDTGLMEKWDFLLEDGEKGTWEWKNWDACGPVKLSSYKTSADGTAIHFVPLKVMDSADSAYFGNDLKLLSD
jgi:hypothetical protein